MRAPMRLMCALPCAQISAVRLGRIDSVVRVGRAARRLGHPRSGKHRAACPPGCDKAPHGGRGAGCGRSLLGGFHSRKAGLGQAVQLARFVSVLVHPRSEGITRRGTRPMSKGPGSVRRAVPAGHRHSRLCILSLAPFDDIGRAHARLVLRADGGDLHRAGRGDPCGSRGAGYCPAPRRPPPAAPRPRHWRPRPVRPISTVCTSRPALVHTSLHSCLPNCTPRGPTRGPTRGCPHRVLPRCGHRYWRRSIGSSRRTLAYTRSIAMPSATSPTRRAASNFSLRS